MFRPLTDAELELLRRNSLRLKEISVELRVATGPTWSPECKRLTREALAIVARSARIITSAS